jgi:cold shock CspA family protein
MKLPVQISFHNLDRIDVVEDRIRREAAQLEEFCKCIMSCRVVVDVPHLHHRKGNACQVRLDIKVPGEEIAIVQAPAQHDPLYENLNAAVRDAFNSAARKLEEHVRRQRCAVKHHAGPTHGRVSNVFRDGGYGFIQAADGHEIYFHANSVLDEKFNELNVGAEVAFAEELGDKGPQASTVRIVGGHHHAL